MPKTKISEYDATAANNTDVNSINIAEGCAPSGINNAIRQVMADLKDFQQGTKGDPFLGPVTPSTLTLTGLTANRVLYTNGSKQVSSSDNVQFDGTTLTVNTLSATSITSVGGSINGMTIGASTASTGNFTTLGATGVATFSAGSVSAPAITTTGDTNTGIFFPAADTIAFTEGGVESMRINSSGNVGIATTSLSNGRLNIVAGTSSTGNSLFLSNNDGTYNPYLQVQHNGINGVKLVNTSSFGGTAGNLTISPAANCIFDTASVIVLNGNVVGYDNLNLTASAVGTNGTVVGINSAGNAGVTKFSINNTERMRIDSSGKLLVGRASAGYSALLAVNGTIETYGPQFNMVTASSGTDFEWVLRVGSRQQFYVTNATITASLSATGVWTNASDARYKENIVDSNYGLDTVMALKPRAYNLINQADKPQIGFIAQEVLDVVPEVVDTTFNSITKEERYTLSYGQLTAVLTKAIQELKAELDSVKAELQTIKGA